jgi:hypothetical protein
MDKTALNISSSSSHLQVGLICHLLPPTLPDPSPGSWCCSKKNLLVRGERDVSGGWRRRHVEWGRAPWRRDQSRGVASVAQPAHGQSWRCGQLWCRAPQWHDRLRGEIPSGAASPGAHTRTCKNSLHKRA